MGRGSPQPTRPVAPDNVASSAKALRAVRGWDLPTKRLRMVNGSGIRRECRWKGRRLPYPCARTFWKVIMYYQ